MAWASKEQAREHWIDAVALTDPVLDRLLTVAATMPAITTWAKPPGNVDPEPVPEPYVLANILQARELYNAIQRGETDVIGVGDYAIRARSLTAAVKALLPRKIGPIG